MIEAQLALALALHRDGWSAAEILSGWRVSTPDGLRLVLWLDRHDYTPHEIASLLNTSERTVYRRLADARRIRAQGAPGRPGEAASRATAG